MRRLIISLVQSINASFAQDGWSTGVSTEPDFKNFVALRRQAAALVIDRRTALNPQLPVINAAGKALEHTPVHVLTESDPVALAKQLSDIGVDYRAQQFAPDTIAEVVATLATRADSPIGAESPTGAKSPTGAAPAEPLRSTPAGPFGIDIGPGDELIVCESGPNLGFRLLEHYPGAELLLSISPRYIHTAGSHFSGLQTSIELTLLDVRTEDEQVYLRYRRA